MSEEQVRPGDMVLYKDQQLIVMNKPAGMPVQADHSGEKSLLDLAEIYAKRQLYLTNRLDRPVGGLVVLAKNPEAAANLHEQLRNRKMQKMYYAITGNKLPDEKGSLTHFIGKGSGRNRSEALDESDGKAKKAELNYQLLGASDRYFLYEIDLITGRHHQIRAQLGKMGAPVRGDEKYGFKRANKDRSINLFCRKMTFIHPTKGEKMEFEAPLPDTKLWQSFKGE
ncbi:MAG: RluA family pseudouridine synthase [Bacteroidetes bacterium]|nr:RluA family pseudouridine synthase [Bacteroidota bacterium]